MEKNKYYLTTAIFYCNAPPHIGHAIEMLYADVMARYQRLLGNDVRFVTGTDEHGQKILKAAEDAGRSPEVHVAAMSALYQNLADTWNISNNDFIRTTEERHKQGAQKFWQAVTENGDIYKKAYTGLYCVGCESFKTEKDVVDGKCPDHHTVPELLTEENYFFRLTRYQEPLLFLFEKNKHFIYPDSKYNEMYNMLKAGLEDVSISRVREKLSWGVPVPGDEAQVMYVWFDALTNYITALGYGSADASLFKKFWPGTNLVGKEINRFHSLLWPAMLMAAGIEPPQQIAVHGWITVEGQKMSKTIGNVIDPLKLVEEFPLEAVRYFLMREIPFDNDGDFSRTAFLNRYQGDLANGIGNLTNRILTMVEKYCGSVVPTVSVANQGLIDFLSTKIWPAYTQGMNRWRFDHALEAVMQFVTHCDQLISDKQPWALAKAGDTEAVNDLLHHLVESLRHIAVMVWPVMPETAESIFRQLGLEVEKELGKPLAELNQWVGLVVGNKIEKTAMLFPRLEEKNEK